MNIKQRYYLQCRKINRVVQQESIMNAMKVLKDEPQCCDLSDSDSNIAFIAKVNKLMKDMLSRTPVDSLRPNDDNISRKLCSYQKYNHYNYNFSIAILTSYVFILN
ncbi:hypothetical protein WA026_023817 [Henosepilachna vigintioctopunctata]|uniref:Uncharacterized protein n=1 Tax=Henosepilachna vigintioctopunctata TaxID=420089 RepID=A0AAW1UPJ3_9CUCU